MPLSVQSLDSINSETSMASDYSPPSSVCSFGDEEHFDDLQRATRSLVKRLIKQKNDHEVVVLAWKERCETLEAEVGRLAKLVIELEAEKKAQSITTPREKPSSSSSSQQQQQQQQSPTRSSTPTLSPRSLPSTSSASSSSAPKVAVHIQGRKCLDWRAAEATNEPIPLVDPSKSMSQQTPSPCNSFYLNGICAVPRCKYSHLYRLTNEQVEEMRRGAQFRLCNALKNGKACRDPDCFYGHHCPRGSTCARKNCSFSEEQHAGPPTCRPQHSRS